MKENKIQKRINVNGNWYVLEEEEEVENTINDIEALVYDGLIYEYDDYAFDVSRIYDYSGEPYDDILIKFTDKTKSPYLEDMWDNKAWMLGVLNKNAESIEEAQEALSESGIKKLCYVVSDLIVRGWLKETE